jgi:hypothetical protein
VITLAWAFLWILVSYRGGNPMWLATPLTIPTYVISVQLTANIWYTGGWMADLFVKKVLRVPWRGFGPWAFALGTATSSLFILLVIFF